MGKLYVGLDVHSKETVYEVQEDSGRTVGAGRVDTRLEGFRKLKEDRSLDADTKIGMESGTVSRFVGKCLSKVGLTSIVIHADEVRRKAHRPNQKNDVRDAHDICDGIRTGQYKQIVYVPSDELATIRVLLSCRRHFVTAATREMTSAKSALRFNGLSKWATGSLLTNVAWTKLRAKVKSFDSTLSALIELYASAWTQAMKNVASLDQKLEAAAAPFKEDLELLQSIPGVGTIVSLTILASMCDASRFPTSKKAASHAGIVPSSYDSADKKIQGSITKAGDPEYRAMLVQAAQGARRPTSPFNPIYLSYICKKGSKKAIVAIAHKICRLAWAVLLTRKPFDLAKIRVEEGPFDIVQKRHYRRKMRSNNPVSQPSTP